MAPYLTLFLTGHTHTNFILVQYTHIYIFSLFYVLCTHKSQILATYKYLNKGLINPYDTHPITIYASISNLLLYFISSIVEARLNHSVDNIFVLVCGHICDLSAALVLTLLASIVFPIPLRWFAYIALVFVLPCRPSCQPFFLQFHCFHT